MQARVSPETVERLEEHTGKPISRGVDKAINGICDKLEELEAAAASKDNEPRVRICANTEEMAEE